MSIGGGSSDPWVRRFSVDQSCRHPGGFTIYKITSVLFPLASPEAVSVVSVWKRYSDICRLHRSMSALHTALHLTGAAPTLPRSGYFRRFEAEVIEERRCCTKKLLEFVADHRLLFTSAEFVNFLQSGYEEVKASGGGGGGVIDTIRSALHLPVEETPPLEYQSDEDTAPLTPVKANLEQVVSCDATSLRDTMVDVSHIEVLEGVDVERRSSPRAVTASDSIDSLSSCSGDGDTFYDELDRFSPLILNKTQRQQLPDLISFPEASTSRSFHDYHDMRANRDNNNATPTDATTHIAPRLTRSLSRQSAMTWSGEHAEHPSEDSYVFEAGYLLSLGARCEDLADYVRAFACYKAGIERMLLGVENDTDQNRRSVIKEKTAKYLAYAEAIYNNHLSGQNMIESDEVSLPPVEMRDVEADIVGRYTLPSSMLRQPVEELAQYRVLCASVAGGDVVCLVHRETAGCLHMKVIHKIPNNMTESDGVYPRASETRMPILATNVPYMVQLRGYIETADLLFLILDHAPGGRLVDHIANYIKRAPPVSLTPSRRPNLDNVFTEPSRRGSTASTQDKHSIDKIHSDVHSRADPDSKEEESRTSEEMSVSDLVINSQRLLSNVEEVLSDAASRDETDDARGGECELDRLSDAASRDETDDARGGQCQRLVAVKKEGVLEKKEREEATWDVRSARDALPPSAVCEWGAELLTAIEHLHNAGVICRELSAEDVLLGEGGHLQLRYAVGYDEEVTLSRLALRSLRWEPSLYIAPELYAPRVCRDERGASETCDWWSYGAVMYELICGVPLSHYHRSVFTSHTILQLPEGLPLDVESFLTQLLRWDPAERLGARGVGEIKSHPYYRDIDWQSVLRAWRPPD